MATEYMDKKLVEYSIAVRLGQTDAEVMYVE